MHKTEPHTIILAYTYTQIGLISMYFLLSVFQCFTFIQFIKAWKAQEYEYKRIWEPPSTSHDHIYICKLKNYFLYAGVSVKIS